MAFTLSRRGIAAAATAVALAAAGMTVPTTTHLLSGSAAVAGAETTVLPVPGFAGYEPPAVVGGKVKLVATVEKGIEGKVEFSLENGTVLGSGDIDNSGAVGRAEYFWAVPTAGTHKVKARILANDGTTSDYTELFNVTALNSGSSVHVDVENEINTDLVIASILGIGASLVALLGSRSTIAALEATTTHVQQQLGIYNEDLAKRVKQALPMVGSVVGGAGLITALGLLIKALVDSKISVTSSTVESN